MPSLLGSKKKLDKKNAPSGGNGSSPYPLTHIVTPAHKLADAKRGEEVAALCGAVVSGDADPAAGICNPCVIAQMKKDDKDADDRAQKRYDAGREAGKQEGIRDGRAEHQRLEREAAAREREEAAKLKFEDLGKTIRFTFPDGPATMRKNRIGSVRYGAYGEGQWAVFVDGVVLVSDGDAALVRRHYDQLMAVVFPNPA